MPAHQHAVHRQDVARHREGLGRPGPEHDNYDVLIQQVFLDVTYANARSLLDYSAVQTRGLEEFQLLADFDLTHMS
jgi:hypothetical protein